jgi:[acyl-carrier-protein] S-malonyltransferase
MDDAAAAGSMIKWVLLFPGQASQYVGMAQDLYDRYPAVRDLFAQADAQLGVSLSACCFAGPEERLRQTAITQPAVFVHSVAVWQVLAAHGLVPAACAGHSLGEYSALVAAGALTVADGLALVGARARLMQRASEERPGTMAAVIGLDDAAVASVCQQAQTELSGEVVVAANFNAPGQVVVSGSHAGVARASDLALQAGARKVAPLAVGGAFHSPLMQSAAAAMVEPLAGADWRRPTASVVTNVDAVPTSDPDRLRDSLARQITEPVRWTESVTALTGDERIRVLEVGPGSVLRGLVRRIAPGIAVQCVGTADELEAALALL